MLQELYDYAIEKGLAFRTGYKSKHIAAYICLDCKGKYLDIEVCPKDGEDYPTPDGGSKAQGVKCHPLITKTSISLLPNGRKSESKHNFYLQMLDDCSRVDPRFGFVADLIRNTELSKRIAKDLQTKGIPDPKLFSFKVDGEQLERSPFFHQWWDENRTRFFPEEGKTMRCLITGELTECEKTIPKIRGLSDVGQDKRDQGSEAVLFCFDKASFRSYGLEKSFNAPVSAAAITAVNAALNSLIQKAPFFAGTKVVYWYLGEKTNEEDDPIGDLIGKNAGSVEWNMFSEDEEEQVALQEASRLIRSVDIGKKPPVLSARYHILILSRVKSRVMVRGWYEGSFEQLQGNISQWFTDLSLRTPRGRGYTPNRKLNALLTRLSETSRRYDDDAKEMWDHLRKELSNLSGRLFDAIIHGHPLPDEVASRALRYIRSGMISGSDDDKKGPGMDMESMAFQLLKAWLVRRQRQRGEITMGEEVNRASASAAYHCGRLMAVYGEIHKAAMPEVNVSVVERYYASAISTPAFVLGKLSRMSIHHLAMLDQDKPKLAGFFRNHLGKIALCIDPNNLPGSLDLEEQTQFALGYYQQRAELFEKKD